MAERQFFMQNFLPNLFLFNIFKPWKWGKKESKVILRVPELKKINWKENFII